jgi:hypothetical protein
MTVIVHARCFCRFGIAAQEIDADALDGPDQMDSNYVFTPDVIGLP